MLRFDAGTTTARPVFLLADVGQGHSLRLAGFDDDIGLVAHIYGEWRVIRIRAG